jgi:hypothetical protein
LSPQDSFPVLGMVILEKLACDIDNCAEMLKARILISEIIGLTRYSTTTPRTMISSGMFVPEFVEEARRPGLARILATSTRALEERFLTKQPHNRCIGGRPQQSSIWEPLMDSIGNLALRKRAGHEIWKDTACISWERWINWQLAGEALANIALQTASAILEEPGYEVAKDLCDLLLVKIVIEMPPSACCRTFVDTAEKNCIIIV